MCVLGVATVGGRTDARSLKRVLELWRCANLINLLSFYAIDPDLYSLDGFVLPVAAAAARPDERRGGAGLDRELDPVEDLRGAARRGDCRARV